jgi:hypothetical protein
VVIERKFSFMTLRQRGYLLEESDGYQEVCPVCGGKMVGTCRCSSRVPHTLDSLKRGHGKRCENGHRWSGNLAVDSNGNEIKLEGS